ncbi:hypothetical protein GCM10027022_07440 [Alpinimonas psychrophila]|uniref:DUF3093 domain-containing protein n=1 Tax=Alpinimonas psychrophila TaxID=748908 RepID=A0A7W3JSR0_9MICO|nr:DUF3093 domain-containing protein [Alpinimonas psychrophila]MBA8828564.1 hypothetical protein [Alpinimonas psychrophila]
MTTYREVMRPAFWLYIAAILIIPAIVLVLAPINMLFGIILSVVVYAVIVLLMIFKSPSIELTETALRVGKASIPRSELGAASGFSGTYAIEQRGTKLDGRAWLMFTGWVDPVVRIDIIDPLDPVPYWLISTRHPEEFVAALRSQR